MHCQQVMMSLKGECHQQKKHVVRVNEIITSKEKNALKDGYSRRTLCLKGMKSRENHAPGVSADLAPLGTPDIRYVSR